jgi:6-pyruvoyltetrahydropterin/6-carboxytetrahydropterin synthase
MYEISITTHFSAAHHLVDYKGACAEPHGHNWETTVFIRGTDLDRLGILVDFRKVKKFVKQAMDELDHTDLNKLPAFSKANPTSENIARHVYWKLSAKLNGSRYAVARVTIAETPGNKVTYWADPSDRAPRKAERRGR